MVRALFEAMKLISSDANWFTKEVYVRAINHSCVSNIVSMGDISSLVRVLPFSLCGFEKNDILYDYQV
jgi:hypothetical protein